MATGAKITGLVTRWWWVRHAPVPNPERRCYGQSDKDCDVSNHALFTHQARLLPKGAVWYASNLLRAKKTAETLATHGAEMGELNIDPNLAEQHFGEWQGLTYVEIAEKKDASNHLFWLGPPEYRPPGGESFVDLRDRTVRSIDRLTAEHRGRDIVATAHGGTIRAALAHAFDLHPEAAVRFEIENVSVTLIEHFEQADPAHAWRVAFVNYMPRALVVAKAAALAHAVGIAGHVLGVDISGTLIEAARAHRLENASFVVGDAATHPFQAGHYDLVFSRFGVMFFADPVAAFRNIRRALKLSGRLVFIAWRTPQENPWGTTPTRAALPFLPPQPRPGPEDPGQFAFGDRARVERILSEAGFHKLRLEPIDRLIWMGDSVAEVVAGAGRFGPLARAFAGAEPAAIEKAKQAIAEALAPHEGPDGVRLPGACWLVEANAN